MFNHLWNSKLLKTLFVFIPLVFLAIVTIITLPNLSKRQSIVNRAEEPTVTCRQVGEVCGQDYKAPGAGDAKWCCNLTACRFGKKDPASRRCYIKASVRKAAVPVSGVLFGAFVNIDRTRQADNLIEVTNAFEGQIGRSLAIDIDYSELQDKFPGKQQEDDRRNGRIPLMSWHGEDTSSINRGELDELLKTRAQEFKQFKDPVMIRFEYEMNLAAGRDNIKSPSSFVLAWRRIWNIFKNEGVENVIWVWNPAVGSFFTPPEGSQKFYPGDNYVDWIAFDGYDRGNMSFADIFRPYYQFWTSRSDKPIMIAEMGTPFINPDTGRRTTDAYRTQWFKDFESKLPTEFPKIKAVLYWDAFGIKRGDNQEKDMRLLDTNSSYFKELKRMVNTPYFNPSTLGEVQPGN